jgi:DDE superfamily endonuclease
LFAALEVATGPITADACYSRHRNGELLAFLKTVAAAHPRVKLHVVVDNYATYHHPQGAGLAVPSPTDQPALHPDRLPWINLVEIFFGIITRQAIRRGTLPACPT